MNRRAPYSHLSAADQADLIYRAFGTSNPALRAENDRRTAERDRAYREQYGLPPARWDLPAAQEPIPFTKAVPTKLGLLITDFEEQAA